MSSHLTPQDKLDQAVKLSDLALQEIGVKLIKSSQTNQKMNLLLKVENYADIPQIKSVIFDLKEMWTSAGICIIKLYHKIEEQANPDLFGTLDLNEFSINQKSEEFPSFQDNLFDQKTDKQIDSQFISKSNRETTINYDYAEIKLRASLGDNEAIRKLINISLINCNIETDIQSDEKILNIKVETNKDLKKEVIISIIKRQLGLIKCDIFHIAKVSITVKGIKYSVETINLTYTTTNNKEKTPPSQLDIKKIIRWGVIASGIIASMTFFNAGFRFSDTGNELITLRSVSGESLAEAYYQEMGFYGWAFANLSYGLGWITLAVTASFAARLTIDD
jgi:hypothetical protein